jgi:hypothetical protein
MKSIHSFFVLILVFSCLISCNKEEVELIKGNNPPPDSTQNKNVRREFIDKAFIILTGREADSGELSWADSLLLAENFTKTSKETVANYITSLPEFLSNEYQLNIINHLDGAVNDNDIAGDIAVYDILLMDNNNAFFFPIFIYEKNRLVAFQQAKPQFLNNEINWKELYQTTLNTPYFDALNMGSLNFVIAAYQLFYQRNPTQSEIEGSVAMIDGVNSVLYSQNGSSKDDFLSIFFNQPAFYEGQVKILFNRLLLRLPTTEEQSFYTNLYLQSQNHRLIISKIVSSDDFIQL